VRCCRLCRLRIRICAARRSASFTLP